MARRAPYFDDLAQVAPKIADEMVQHILHLP